LCANINREGVVEVSLCTGFKDVYHAVRTVNFLRTI
jgi:hypothetical protein